MVLATVETRVRISGEKFKCQLVLERRYKILKRPVDRFKTPGSANFLKFITYPFNLTIVIQPCNTASSCEFRIAPLIPYCTPEFTLYLCRIYIPTRVTTEAVVGVKFLIMSYIYFQSTFSSNLD